MVTSTLENTCCRVDVLEGVINKEVVTFHFVDNSFEVVLIGHEVIDAHTREKEEYARLLHSFITYAPRQCP